FYYPVLRASQLTICLIVFFFFINTPTTVIYTLSLHDALPISFTFAFFIDPKREWTVPGAPWYLGAFLLFVATAMSTRIPRVAAEDRKSTRLNSSHLGISYAVFCLKKKKKIKRYKHSDRYNQRT